MFEGFKIQIPILASVSLILLLTLLPFTARPVVSITDETDFFVSILLIRNVS